MTKIRVVSFIAALLFAVSCGRPSAEKHIPELLDFVPSDAIAVLCYDRCDDGLALLDSSYAIQKIDYGRLAGAKAAISLCYTTSMVPILAIDAGRAAADTSAAVSDILAQAEELGLQASYIYDQNQKNRHGALVITNSAAEFRATQQHFQENTSIKDAPGFKDALKVVEGKDWIIFRNQGADRYLPRTFLSKFVQRREFTTFMQKSADWTVVQPEGQGKYSVTPIYGDFDTYYPRMLASLPLSTSRLGPMIPRSTEFTIALPIQGDKFRKAYENYLDACVKLEKYQANLAALQKESGKDPLKWEKELDVREVAVVKWNNRAVTLVRTGKSAKEQEIETNPWRGFIPALYGSAFAINDDSCVVRSGNWTIFGGEDDLQAFLGCDHGVEKFSWPGKHSRLVIFKPGTMLSWGKDGIYVTVRNRNQ